MLTRIEVLSRAAEDCIKELYSLAQPHIDWKEFKKECKQYSDRYQTWEDFRKAQIKKNEFPKEWEHQKIIHPNWENKNITECIGPRPWEFYYLPEDVMKDIVEEYVYAYKIDTHQELLDTIVVLKNYCKEPIVDKYIEGDLREDGTRWPGHRGYDHPDNLEKEIEKILFGRMSEEPGEYREESAKILQNKFFEFLDMAGKFYNWNGELNAFNTEVYLGVSPNTNKEEVIDNWKIYRKQTIEIDDSEYDEYYEE